MSFSETIFLFVLALMVFGPKKLPEIARQLGRLMAEFRRASNEFKSQIEQEISHLEVEDRRKAMLATSAPPPEGTAARKPITTRGELTTLEAPATLAASPENAPSGDSGKVATEAVAPAQSGEPLAADSVATSPESHQESQQESHA